jgi:hypothetical protein
MVVVRAMARSISTEDQVRGTPVDFDIPHRPNFESEADIRSGNAIVGVAVSAVLWLMLALVLFFWFT